MKWEPTSKYSIRSGPFVVTKNWTAEGWIYLAFRDRELLGRFPDGATAKTFCERQP